MTGLLFTGVRAPSSASVVRCPGSLGFCSPVCPLGVLCCVCGVRGHLPPVHRCPARCIALCERCPGPFGSCSPVCPLVALPCVCSVLGHLAPVHRCARSVGCVACAVSGATCLLFTGVPAPCAVLRVRCPGPLGSCSPMCPLGGLRCVCGVLGHLPPVHRFACFVRCVACAVSWGTWLLFNVVSALCVVLRLRCPGPLVSCTLVCPLGVLCCVCGVLGHLAPVHRCAGSVCCAVGCVCGASLQGARSSIRTAAVCSRQGLLTLLACTLLSGRRLFCSWQQLGTLPGAHSSIHTAAICSL